jgi:hypothetical protein
VLLTLLRARPYNETMTFTRPLQYTNRVVPIRPLVRLAAKLVGAGPNRLRMVKLSHELGEDGRHL